MADRVEQLGRCVTQLQVGTNPGAHTQRALATAEAISLRPPIGGAACSTGASTNGGSERGGAREQQARALREERSAREGEARGLLEAREALLLEQNEVAERKAQLEAKAAENAQRRMQLRKGRRGSAAGTMAGESWPLQIVEHVRERSALVCHTQCRAAPGVPKEGCQKFP